MAFRNGWTVRDIQGNAVPNASVYWCTQPATTNVVPPSPLASLFTDSTGVTPATNPQVTNGFGQVATYLNQGTYTVVEVWGGVVQNVYPDQIVGISSGGSVTSVALSVPAEFSVSGSPVTTSGTLSFSKANQAINTVYAGPSSGSAAAPTFRSLTIADMPSNFTGLNWVDIRTKGASNAGTNYSDEGASINSTSSTLTVIPSSGGGLFVQADQGKAVQVQGAGPNGGDLFTTIATVISSTQVTLAAAASTTVNNHYAWWYPAAKDDTAAIQAAINACSSTQTTVYIPTGVYVISSPLVMSDFGISFIGDDGWTSWIVVSSAAFSGNGLDYTSVDNRLTGIQLLNVSTKGPGTPTTNAGTITNAALTTNVVTFTQANSYVAGQKILVLGFTNSLLRILNNIEYTVASSSGTTWTASITNGNIVSTADTAAAIPSMSGVAWGTSRFCTVRNGLHVSWPGAGFLSRDSIVSSFENIVGQNCGVGLAFFQPTTAAAPTLGTVGGTSLNFNSCYGNACDTAGFYAFQLIYSSMSGVAGDSNGTAYFFDTCQSISVQGNGCEGTQYFNAAFPGDAFRVFHSQGIQLNSIRAFWTSASDARSQCIRYISASRCTAINPHSIVASTGGVAPTLVFSFDAGSINNTVWEAQFDVSGSSAWLDSGTNNTVFYGGTWHTNLRVAQGVFPVLSTPNYVNSPVVVNGDFSLSAAWGSTGAISNLAGSNASGNIQITAGGTGIVANPTITFTYHAGDTFTSFPVIMQSRFDSSTEVGTWQLTAKSNTTCTWMFLGTPTTGHTYGLSWYLAAKQ